MFWSLTVYFELDINTIQKTIMFLFFNLMFFNVIFLEKKGTFKSTVYWRLPYFTELPCLFILYPDFLVELSFETISNTAICNQSFCFNVQYVHLFILQGKSASEDHKSCRSPCIPSFKLPGNEHTDCQ